MIDEKEKIQGELLYESIQFRTSKRIYLRLHIAFSLYKDEIIQGKKKLRDNRAEMLFT